MGFEVKDPPRYVRFSLGNVRITEGNVEHTGYVDITARFYPEGGSDVQITGWGFDPGTKRVFRDVTPCQRCTHEGWRHEGGGCSECGCEAFVLAAKDPAP